MGPGIEKTHGNPQHHSIAKNPTRSAPASSTEALPSLTFLTGIASSTLEEVAQGILAHESPGPWAHSRQRKSAIQEKKHEHETTHPGATGAANAGSGG